MKSPHSISSSSPDVRRCLAAAWGLRLKKMTLREYAAFLDETLDTKCQAWGDPSAKVQKVAVVGGAADSDFRAAKAAGADVFVTGEVKQRIALEAGEIGIPIVAAGHYATEHPGCVQLKNRLSVELPGSGMARL